MNSVLVESYYVLGLSPANLPNVSFPTLEEINGLTCLVNTCKPKNSQWQSEQIAANSSKRETLLWRIPFPNNLDLDRFFF